MSRVKGALFIFVLSFALCIGLFFVLRDDVNYIVTFGLKPNLEATSLQFDKLIVQSLRDLLKNDAGLLTRLRESISSIVDEGVRFSTLYSLLRTELIRTFSGESVCFDQLYLNRFALDQKSEEALREIYSDLYGDSVDAECFIDFASSRVKIFLYCYFPKIDITQFLKYARNYVFLTRTSENDNFYSLLRTLSDDVAKKKLFTECAYDNSIFGVTLTSAPVGFLWSRKIAKFICLFDGRIFYHNFYLYFYTINLSARGSIVVSTTTLRQFHEKMFARAALALSTSVRDQLALRFPAEFHVVVVDDWHLERYLRSLYHKVVFTDEDGLFFGYMKDKYYFLVDGLIAQLKRSYPKCKVGVYRHKCCFEPPQQ